MYFNRTAFSFRCCLRFSIKWKLIYFVLHYTFVDLCHLYLYKVPRILFNGKHGARKNVIEVKMCSWRWMSELKSSSNKFPLWKSTSSSSISKEIDPACHKPAWYVWVKESCTESSIAIKTKQNTLTYLFMCCSCVENLIKRKMACLCKKMTYYRPIDTVYTYQNAFASYSCAYMCTLLSKTYVLTFIRRHIAFILLVRSFFSQPLCGIQRSHPNYSSDANCTQ